MYRLKSVATPSLKPPERSKRKKKKREKIKRKRKKNRTKKEVSSLLILCHGHYLCVRVCFQKRRTEGLPGATPARGRCHPSPAWPVIGACRISPFAKAEFSLLIFLWGRPCTDSGQRACRAQPGRVALHHLSPPCHPGAARRPAPERKHLKIPCPSLLSSRPRRAWQGGCPGLAQ